MLTYLWPFLGSIILTIFFTLLIKELAQRWQIVDRPFKERKIHLKPTPLLGGLAIFGTVFLLLGYYTFFTDEILNGFHLKNIVGLFIAGLILMIAGFLDDKYDLPPSRQIIGPLLAVIIVIISGIGIREITNPFGGVFKLDIFENILFWREGVAYRITWLADIFTLIWLMGMMYTTKFLDGLDGLVSGIVAIGALLIFALSLSDKFFQPHTAYPAIILAGACLGFLIFNFHPARIFLGEGGALYLGFMLGVLAIIFGGKIATTLLVMGIPILDVLWVILRRVFWEKKSIVQGDRKHLHFRLLDLGLSQRQAVVFLYILAASFGILTLFLQSKQKLIALSILSGLMLVMALILVFNRRLFLTGLKK